MLARSVHTALVQQDPKLAREMVTRYKTKEAIQKIYLGFTEDDWEELNTLAKS